MSLLLCSNMVAVIHAISQARRVLDVAGRRVITRTPRDTSGTRRPGVADKARRVEARAPQPVTTDEPSDHLLEIFASSLRPIPTNSFRGVRTRACTFSSEEDLAA